MNSEYKEASRPNDVLVAMRADAIPAGTDGLWRIVKWSVPCKLDVQRNGKIITITPGSYTNLFRATLATMQGEGELVMHDEPHELRKHLQFCLRAHGNVLVTGLGLGCVARGLLANPKVGQVTVIEKSSSVLKLVAPSMPESGRLKIVHADALKWCRKTKEKFDFCFHDLWTDEANGDEHVQVEHQKLIIYMRQKASVQGAWEFPRDQRRALRGIGFSIV